MKAKIEPGYDTERQRLADIVPIDAPFTMFIASTHVCNFKCFYCTQSLSEQRKNELGFQQSHMSYELFRKIVCQAKEFGGIIKRVVFTGLGEPLANPKIAEMISELSGNHIAQGYEIITNAYLLTHDMTDKLLEAGLTFLRVSIQGLSAKRYKEISGVDISYEQLVDNLRYFYHKKGACKLYIKIMDVCLEENETEADFFNVFGDICDKIYIEHLVNAQPSMNGDYGDKLNVNRTFYGEESEYREVCPFMFYSLQIDAAGNTFPCPPLGLPLYFSLGNVWETTLKEIWTSEKLYRFYRLQLTGNKDKVPVCAKCECYKTFTPKEDNLDNDKEQILKRLEVLQNGRK